MPRLYQGSFNSGEVSPSLYGRIDLERFKSALRVCRNMVPLAEGGVVKRPGLEFVGYALNAPLDSVRLIPFKFNNEQTYMIGATPTELFFMKDGGFILNTMNAKGGTGTPTVSLFIDQVMVTYTTHGYSNGDVIFWAAGGYDQMYREWFTVTGATAGTFKLNYYTNGTGVDGSSFAVDAATIDFGEPYQVSAGWFSGVDVSELDYTQANNKLYISHPDGPTKVITRSGDTDWTIVDFSASPVVISPILNTTPLEVGTEPNASITPAATTIITHPSGAYTLNTPYYVASGGFDELVGRWIQVKSPVGTSFRAVDHEDGLDIDCTLYTPAGIPVLTQPVTGPPTGAPAVKLSYAITAIDKETFEESIATLIDLPRSDSPIDADEADLFWDDQADAKTFRIYKAVGGIYGLIGSVEDPDPDNLGDALTFRDNGITPNLAIAPPLEADFFNATGKYPGAVELFQQRIWFGRTDLLLRDFYASRSGSLSSFATSTINTDDDPISQTIAAKSVQEVRYFIPLRDMVILTSDAEWGLDSGNDNALTPSLGLIAQSFWGSARVKPTLVGDSAVFVEKSGRSVRDLAFALQSDGFASTELSIFARHLFANRTVVAMCYAERPYSLLFMVMSDGRALSCTYVRDQQIFAWAQHETRGRMLDCASVIEQGSDNIYVTVQRSARFFFFNGTASHIQVERMRMLDSEYSDRGVYLDNSVVEEALPTDDIVWPRVLQDQLQVMLPAATADDSVIKVSAAAGSILESLEGLSLMVSKVGVSQSVQTAYPTLDWYAIYRADLLSTTQRKALAWSGLIPETAVFGAQAKYVLGVANRGFRGLHNLALRDQAVIIRSDTQEIDLNANVSLGIWVNNASVGASLVAGEAYTSEIETLDIDDATDPITGLPIQLGSLLIRFGLVMQCQMGRDRDNLVTFTSPITLANEDFNFNRLAHEGLNDEILFPRWGRRGRVVIKSENAFPLSILAVIPQIEAGDVDS